MLDARGVTGAASIACGPSAAVPGSLIGMRRVQCDAGAMMRVSLRALTVARVGAALPGESTRTSDQAPVSARSSA
jgi:hypothetical protein